MVRTDGLIEEAGAAALGIETEVVARYKQLLALLCDQVARTYALAETPEMEELDKQRDALGQYIIENVRSAQNVPIASKAEAAHALWMVLKPYVGFYSLANQQESMMLRGMLNDLQSEKNAPHVATLGLQEFITELAAVKPVMSNLRTSAPRSARRRRRPIAPRCARNWTRCMTTSPPWPSARAWLSLPPSPRSSSPT